ncbi:MAG: hypothetical protein KDD50_07360 [Bdellovibrionales bacterium]|nr:hypothetical protein [Bdellovibrionales bacterium]
MKIFVLAMILFGFLGCNSDSDKQRDGWRVRSVYVNRENKSKVLAQYFESAEGLSINDKFEFEAEDLVEIDTQVRCINVKNQKSFSNHVRFTKPTTIKILSWMPINEIRQLVTEADEYFCNFEFSAKNQNQSIHKMNLPNIKVSFKDIDSRFKIFDFENQVTTDEVEFSRWKDYSYLFEDQNSDFWKLICETFDVNSMKEKTGRGDLSEFDFSRVNNYKRKDQTPHFEELYQQRCILVGLNNEKIITQVSSPFKISFLAPTLQVNVDWTNALYPDSLVLPVRERLSNYNLGSMQIYNPYDFFVYIKVPKIISQYLNTYYISKNHYFLEHQDLSFFSNSEDFIEEKNGMLFFKIKAGSTLSLNFRSNFWINCSPNPVSSLLLEGSVLFGAYMNLQPIPISIYRTGDFDFFKKEIAEVALSSPFSEGFIQSLPQKNKTNGLIRMRQIAKIPHWHELIQKNRPCP